MKINLVTFKRWDGVKDEKFLCHGGSLKNLVFRGWGGGHEKPIHTAELAKKERLDSLLISGGLGEKQGGRGFWGGGGAHYEQAVFHKIT